MFVQISILISWNGNQTKSLSVSETFSCNWQKHCSQCTANTLPFVVQQTQRTLAQQWMSWAHRFNGPFWPNRTHHSPCNLVNGTPSLWPSGILTGDYLHSRGFFFFFQVGPTLSQVLFLGTNILGPHCFVLVFWAHRMFRSISAHIYIFTNLKFSSSYQFKFIFHCNLYGLITNRRLLMLVIYMIKLLQRGVLLSWISLTLL